MLASMQGADAIIFTGGIGEDSAEVRARICDGLEWAGLKLDPARNEQTASREGQISADGSRLAAYVIPTDEELLIARDTARLDTIDCFYFTSIFTSHPSSHHLYFTPIFTSHPSATGSSNAKAKIPAPKNAHGQRQHQASSRLRNVSICNPEPLANIVPAMPDESTCVASRTAPTTDKRAIGLIMLILVGGFCR